MFPAQRGKHLIRQIDSNGMQFRLFVKNAVQLKPGAAADIYANADFDTIEKALSSQKMAEKGTITGLPWSITDFRSPAFLYGIVGGAV